MIAYFDTSALVKLYVDEPEREKALRIAREATSVAISELGLVEAHSALRRKGQQEHIKSRKVQSAITELEKDWPSFSCVLFQGELIEQTRKIIKKHLLRTYDAIHLASALVLAQGLGSSIGFLCFDERLNEVAVKHRLLKIL